jgi:hypothetical protein
MITHTPEAAAYGHSIVQMRGGRIVGRTYLDASREHGDITVCAKRSIASDEHG